MVFEYPEMTILSGHVEGKRIKELHSHLRVEITSASEPLRTEAVFPLPLSNFFQVKDLPRGKHLVQLQCALPSNTHRFKSEVIEVDLERHSQIHVGPIRFEVKEDHQKQVRAFISKYMVSTFNHELTLVLVLGLTWKSWIHVFDFITDCILVKDF